jgi:hypothetical protein
VIGISKPVLDPAELWPDQMHQDRDVQSSTESAINMIQGKP